MDWTYWGIVAAVWMTCLAVVLIGHWITRKARRDEEAFRRKWEADWEEFQRQRENRG